MKISKKFINYCLEMLTKEKFFFPKNSCNLFKSKNIELCIQYDHHRKINAHKNIIYIIPANSDFYLKNDVFTKSNSIRSKNFFPNNYNSDKLLPPPVIFWGEGYEDGNKPFAERLEDDSVVFYADIIASTFFMLTRWEETASPVRDEHGRFPATESVAYKHGFLDRPIIDEYALILASWIKTLLPGWEPKTSRFSIKLSHDIDLVRTASLRRITGDLVKRHSPFQAIKTFCHWTKPINDPAVQGCYELADLSERHGFQSAFYFMAAKRSAYDVGYDPLSKIPQRLIHDLRHRGHEIGFHAGYETSTNLDRFQQEKNRLDAAIGVTRYGGRQHYLKFSTPETWRIWSEMGLEYDSTVGYADYEGFRCGTCHPFHPFDVEKDMPLDILEIPLIVMDGTLKQYRKLTPEQAAERIITLASRCKMVNGVFTLLWHNTSLHGDWEKWKIMYKNLLIKLNKICDY